MHLIIDTESTTFPNPKLPPDHPEQAHIVQLACLMLDSDLNEVSNFYTLIYPNGWKINPGAEAVHKISLERCYKYGISIEAAMVVLTEMVECSKRTVAHNFSFDNKMIQIEKAIDLPKPTCTMLLTTDLCKLPGGKFGNKYKWPKLAEALATLLNESLDKAHDAMSDVRGCAKLYRYLLKNNFIEAI